MRDTIIRPRFCACGVTTVARDIGKRLAAEDRTLDRAEAESKQLETDKRLLMELADRRGLLVLKVWLGEAQRYQEQITIGGRR